MNSNEQEVIRLAKAYCAADGPADECDAVFDLGEFALGLARELEQEERLRHQCEEALVKVRGEVSRLNNGADAGCVMFAEVYDSRNRWRITAYVMLAASIAVAVVVPILISFSR